MQRFIVAEETPLMPTLHRLSKTERETLREAFRAAAWLEPSPSAPNDPDKAEWAAFEDDALMRMIPAFEALLEARAADETPRPGAPSAERQERVKERLKDSPFTKDDEPEPTSTQKPGDSFGDFLHDMAAPFMGEVAGFIVGSRLGTHTGSRSATRSQSRSGSTADLFTGLIPAVVDVVSDLLDPTDDEATAKTSDKPGGKPDGRERRADS